MNGEFTTLCNNFYYIIQKLYKQQDILKEMEQNLPVYNGQGNTSDVDEMIDHYRKGMAVKRDYDETYKRMLRTESRIVMFMRDLDIPPRHVFVNTIPYEVEYELWRTTNDRICAVKLKDLEPEPENPNMMYIKVSFRDGLTLD